MMIRTLHGHVDSDTDSDSEAIELDGVVVEELLSVSQRQVLGHDLVGVPQAGVAAAVLVDREVGGKHHAVDAELCHGSGWPEQAGGGAAHAL